MHQDRALYSLKHDEEEHVRSTKGREREEKKLLLMIWALRHLMEEPEVLQY